MRFIVTHFNKYNVTVLILEQNAYKININNSAIIYSILKMEPSLCKREINKNTFIKIFTSLYK
jgi:hypothetical protein